MKILAFTLNELRLFWRSKLDLLLLLFLPPIMIGLMGFALGPIFSGNNAIERFPVIYINQDQGQIGRAFDSFLQNEGSKYLELVDGTGQDPHDLVNRKKYPVAIIVPEELTEKLLKGEQGSIEVFGTGRDVFKENLVNSLIGAFASRYNSQVALTQKYLELMPAIEASTVIDTFDNVTNRYGTDFVRVTNEVSENGQELSSFQFFSASFLIFFLLVSGTGMGSRIINEISDGTYQRIHAYPVKSSQYLLGKILGNGLVAVVQALAIILATRFLFDINWGENLLGLGMTVLLVILISSALAIVLASIVPSAKAVNSAGIIIVWLMTFLSGGFTSFIFSENLAKLTINKWAFDSLKRLMKGASLDGIGQNLVILLGLAIFLWLLGISLINRRMAHE